MAQQGVISDSTDPATLRPDLPPATATGSRFIPMKLPDFCPRINLPPHIKPDNAWELFTLYFPREQLEIIVRNTNNHVDHLALYELNEQEKNDELLI
ncbi:hypothetical protein MMC14_010636 [Varicellaria rhodocarpa]|nr:hypothetical protein [Varicellaria rhodocarpa]